ncbi:MAG: rRNA maturation RNase YbeY [Planctomycetota bacterium]|jgi:probable rRNA maturation factor
MPIEIHNLQTHLQADLKLIERAVAMTADRNDPDISIAVVDDEAIQRVNAEYLGSDRATDVIAFNYEEEERAEPLSGEVIVSAETAKRVAEMERRDPGAELILYIVHGVLHLKGFDDKTPEEAAAMWRLQNDLMQRLGFREEFKP